MRDPKSLALALAAPLLWGTTFTLSKPAVEHFPPIFLMFCAYLFVALATQLSPHTTLQTKWWQSLIIATFGVTLQGALLFTAIDDVEATTANLALQMQVPAAALMGWLMIGEKLTRRKILGMTMACIGVIIVIGFPEKRPPLVPVIMIVASGIIWAFSQVLVRKWSRDGGSMVLRANALYGLPQLALATLLLETGQIEALRSATFTHWLMLGFVCICGFYVAYMCWFSLLKRVPVDEAVPFILLMTPIGILTAVLFLGERMQPMQVLGGAILMLGLAILNGIGLPKARLASPDVAGD